MSCLHCAMVVNLDTQQPMGIETSTAISLAKFVCLLGV